MRLTYSPNPPSIAPTRFQPSAAEGSWVRRNDEANIRPAPKIGTATRRPATTALPAKGNAKNVLGPNIMPAASDTKTIA